MASVVRDRSHVGAQVSDDPRRALAVATGAEVGIFGRGLPEFPETCVRSCLAAGQDGGAQGACALVCGLIEGVIPEDFRDPRSCERGYPVAIHPVGGTTATVFVLHTSGIGAGEPRYVPSAEQMQAMATLWGHFARLDQEGQGLALELISSYEQLNVIFDITKWVGDVQDVDGIKRFLLQELVEALSCDWACCISEKEETHWWSSDGEDDRSATIAWIRHALGDVLERVTRQQQVIVRNKSQDPGGEPACAIMAGPFGSVDDLGDVIVLGRRSGRGEFLSGDMRMLDSVLSHGGQVISNLRLMARLKTMSMEAVLALVNAIDKKDTYTHGHSERVGFLSRLIGEEMGLAGTDLQDLEWAGILHDVGKIGISDGILTKSGSLTDQEFDRIKQHPRMSFQVIEPLRSFGAVREAVLHHHETPDGKGYPDGLRGEEIPLLSRIIHIADTFDALTSDRSYRRSFGLEEALEIMRAETGTKIDRRIMEAFDKALEAFRTAYPDRFRELFGHVREPAE